MDLTVCERWRLPAPDQTAGQSAWFYDWVRSRPVEVSRHLTAGYYAYLSLQLAFAPGEVQTAREYFGGIGAQALMIQEQFQPKSHWVLDMNPDAVRHLTQALKGKPVQILQADSYDERNTIQADLVGLDFGDLTAWRLRPGEPQRELLDRVFSERPGAVVLTDVAGPRLHLHRDRYQSVLGGHGPAYSDYLSALGWWVEGVYGYAPLRTYHHRWSSVTSFVRSRDACLRAGGHQINPVPDRPVGLELP